MVSVNQPAHVDNAREIIAIASLLGRAHRTIESTIEGHSMGTTLPPGSRVRIRLGAGSAPIGAVVVVAVDTTLFAHRLVARGRGRRARHFIITRGDGILLCDAPVEASQVIGVVDQRDDGSAWHPVPGAETRSPVLAWMAVLHFGAMRTALEVHVALARGLAMASFGLTRAVAHLTMLHRSDISVAKP